MEQLKKFVKENQDSIKDAESACDFIHECVHAFIDEYGSSGDSDVIISYITHDALEKTYVVCSGQAVNLAAALAELAISDKGVAMALSVANSFIESRGSEEEEEEA